VPVGCVEEGRHGPGDVLGVLVRRRADQYALCIVEHPLPQDERLDPGVAQRMDGRDRDVLAVMDHLMLPQRLDLTGASRKTGGSATPPRPREIAPPPFYFSARREGSPSPRAG